MDYAMLLQLTLEVSKPVDELQVAIVKMASMHPGQQLNILKDIETWIRETIVELEKQSKPTQPKEGEQNA